MQILETERLKLRRFTPEDAEFIIRLVNSPGWIEYIGDRNIKTSEQAGAYLLNGPMKSYEENGFGLWMVELKLNGAPIGMCGIIKREMLDHPDLGFALLPEFTHQGYAFEMTNATIDYAKKILAIPIIMAITLAKNQASIRLLEKLSFSFVRVIDAGTDLQLYAND